MALGFLVDDVPMCCSCALYYAEQSGAKHLFFAINNLVVMDSRKKCICGKHPNSKENEDAADEIIKILNGRDE